MVSHSSREFDCILPSKLKKHRHCKRCLVSTSYISKITSLNVLLFGPLPSQASAGGNLKMNGEHGYHFDCSKRQFLHITSSFLQMMSSSWSCLQKLGALKCRTSPGSYQDNSKSYLYLPRRLGYHNGKFDFQYYGQTYLSIWFPTRFWLVITVKDVLVI